MLTASAKLNGGSRITPWPEVRSQRTAISLESFEMAASASNVVIRAKMPALNREGDTHQSETAIQKTLQGTASS